MKKEPASLQTGRTRMIRSLDGMMTKGLRLLGHLRIARNGRKYKSFRKEFNLLEYQVALSAWLQTHNFPEIGLQQDLSANPDPRYEGKLPIYGAVAILELAPILRDRLESLGEAQIHIGEACELAEHYSIIYTAFLTINLPASERKRQSVQKAADKKARGDLMRSVVQPRAAEVRKALFPSKDQLSASWQRWANEYGQAHRHRMKIDAVAMAFHEHSSFYLKPGQKPFSYKTLRRKLNELSTNMKRPYKAKKGRT